MFYLLVNLSKCYLWNIIVVTRSLPVLSSLQLSFHLVSHSPSCIPQLRTFCVCCFRLLLVALINHQRGGWKGKEVTTRVRVFTTDYGQFIDQPRRSIVGSVPRDHSWRDHTVYRTFSVKQPANTGMPRCRHLIVSRLPNPERKLCRLLQIQKIDRYPYRIP